MDWLPEMATTPWRWTPNKSWRVARSATSTPYDQRVLCCVHVDVMSNPVNNTADHHISCSYIRLSTGELIIDAMN
jgi:hypothetical protein